MTNYIYETHNMQDPLLPFIFHRNTVVMQQNSLPNWHENIELLYCTSGKGFVQCGPESYPFATGEIFVVNADSPHCICSAGSIVYHCLIIDNAFCASNGLAVDALYFQNKICDEAMNAHFEAVAAAFEKMDKADLCAVADVRYFVLGLLRCLCRSYTVTKPSTTGAANEHVKRATTYIRRNISSTLTLDGIAEYTGVSKYHLCREFKAFTGKTIVQTINLIRCTEAKTLMERGASVCAAAEACGFESSSYFSRTFKKMFGKLPSEYLTAGSRTSIVKIDEDFCC